ncbi:MAG: hypothetical protein K2Q18_19025 [Bdellovibrionales bacterium]|nr:hypothetical protein [Bdellovibrionales bacterium]
MKSLSIVMAFVCLLAVNTTSAFAKSAEGFQKRFQIIRSDDGKLVGIRDRTMPVKFEVAPYVQMIKSQLKAEQALMSEANLASGEYESLVRSALNEDRDLFLSQGVSASEYEAYVQTVVDSLKKLAVVNVDGVFSNPAFNEVVSKFEGKITDAILLLDPTILANTQDPSFFYKRNVTYQAVSWALDFAKKRLSSIPILNTASYVVVQVEKLITERRNFHQNMLLHYLENFDEKELGLTHDEVNMVWSSIYESRIPWYAFWESSTAKGNWNKYGVNNFYANYRAATAKIAKAGAIYTEVNERMNYAFQSVVYNNEKVVVNLFDNESMFQSRPAVAYNYDRPTQISRKRIMMTLAQLGLSFVPLNATIKDTAGNFIKSFYAKQKITEGALYGYFESMGEQAGMGQVKAQYLNPFDGLVLR